MLGFQRYPRHLAVLGLAGWLVFALPPCAFSQKRKNRKDSTSAERVDQDQSGGQKEILSFEDFNSSAPARDSGLFTVYQKNSTYYYEVPDSLLGRDMLLVSRIVRLPAGFGGGYVNAGSKRKEQLVRWEKQDERILVRTVSYNNVAPDSIPIHYSVEANNYAPILYAFNIHALGRDSASYIFRVNDLFEKDVKGISGLNKENRKEYKVGGVDATRTFIRQIHAYPSNIEAQHEITYLAEEPPSDAHVGAITLLLNQSMVLLPEVPMRPRLHDPRVGWFTVKKINYGSEALKADAVEFIRRWRLEPSDPEAYARGELVAPVKPIIYFIDPATPKKWRPYFKAGVELWQQVFETAGFRDAIVAKDPPGSEESPDFSPEDVRYSVIRYVASTTRNAMGPSVIDPRSGEILESDIIWYHNHLRSYRNRFLVETGGANPLARTLDTPVEQIGEMMKMVIAHEVGHALGLPHNMKASSAYPVDSLRSVSFTRKYGIAATIMDYARFNYVAQPGDGDVRFIRQMGPYDHYAIEWGYRVIPGTSNYAEEKPVLDNWIEQRTGDPVYRFGSGYSGADPSAQTEDIGDDPVLASGYALQNLKEVADKLLLWTTDEDDDYEELKELYGELFRAWGRYAGHVINVIGGVYHTILHYGQDGIPFEPVGKEEQQSALAFIMEHVLDNHDWLLRADILQRTGMETGVERIRTFQQNQLEKLLNPKRLGRLEEQELAGGDQSYGIHAYMNDLRRGIWDRTVAGDEIDIHRRNLQRTYLNMLEQLIDRTADPEGPAGSTALAGDPFSGSEVGPAAFRQANILLEQLTPAVQRYPLGPQRDHVRFVLHRLRSMLIYED